MSHFDFAGYIDRLLDLPPHQALETINQEYPAIKHRAERGIRRGSKHEPDYEAQEKKRLLAGLLFFIQSGVKPNGLSNDEFALVRPLVEKWVERGQYKAEGLEVFGK